MPYLPKPKRAKSSPKEEIPLDSFQSITGSISGVTKDGWTPILLSEAPASGRIIRVRVVKTGGLSSYIDVGVSENNNQDNVGMILMYSNAAVGSYGLDSGEEIYYSSQNLYLLVKAASGATDLEYRIDIQTQGEIQVSQSVAGSRVIPPYPTSCGEPEGGVETLHDLTSQVGFEGNMDYVLDPPAIVETVKVILNGLTMMEGPNADYVVLSPTHLVLNDPPYAGATLQASYVEST